MRVLLLTRGSAGCGKSTWIQESGLKPYTLCADDIRLLCQSTVMLADGTQGISQDNDSFVWRTLFQLLEIRMQRGEFTVIDATNSKTSEMNRYKQLAIDYRYRIYCVDFTDIPMEETKRRNASREAFRRVSDDIIERLYSRFATQRVPSGITVIRPDELEKIWLKMIDLSAYKKVHHIGDIHGCNTVLQDYLESEGGMKEDEFYIFVGDYIDRGLENAEVLQFLITIKDQKNVLLLEGNHEKWLWLWSHDKKGNSKEFEKVTKSALETAEIDKKQVRQFYRKLGQCAYYRYGEDVYFVSHAGISTLPDKLTFLAAEQMIKGVGNYNDFEKIADTFYRTVAQNHYQIHGHRNTKQVPTQVNEKVFNLEGQVEFGGCLRCVQVTREGRHIVECQNRIYKEPEITTQVADTVSVEELIGILRKNRFIQEKEFGNISSFNFTRKAFEHKVWNEQTMRARGLYLDTVKGKVVARAYDKFFNINERPETKLEALQHTLQFPVTTYVKENGFLGIVSYLEEDDSLFVTTKSAPNGDYAGWFRRMLSDFLGEPKLTELKEYCKEYGVSFVFECVDVEHDPHIIEYQANQIILLDIIYNCLAFSKYEYAKLCNLADRFGFAPKEIAAEIASWQEFYDWYNEVMEADYEYRGRKIEGFVIEDSTLSMTKLKLSYYSFWKLMRGVAHETIRSGYIRRTSILTTPLANEFYAWLRKVRETEEFGGFSKDICSLRRLYYKSKT